MQFVYYSGQLVLFCFGFASQLALIFFWYLLVLYDFMKKCLLYPCVSLRMNSIFDSRDEHVIQAQLVRASYSPWPE